MSSQALYVQPQLDLWREEFEDTWLPRYPLAGDVKGQHPWLKRMSRKRALRLPHIEANPYQLRSLMVVDHDGADAEWAADLAGLPRPSYRVLNPHTGSGHIVYALAEPVTVTDIAHVGPIRKLAAIQDGLVQALAGDPAYGGRVTKNPLHDDHLLLIDHDGLPLYTLDDLARPLKARGVLEPQVKKRASTWCELSRNCILFDRTRTRAYRAIRRFWGGPLRKWEADVLAHAYEVNATTIAGDFPAGPLPLREVEHLAHSVATWTWERFTPQRWERLGRTDAKKQAERARKSAEARNGWKAQAIEEYQA